MSEVLVLGTYSEGGVVLITPDKKVQNGDKLGWRGESHKQRKAEETICSACEMRQKLISERFGEYTNTRRTT